MTFTLPGTFCSSDPEGGIGSLALKKQKREVRKRTAIQNHPSSFPFIFRFINFSQLLVWMQL